MGRPTRDPGDGIGAVLDLAKRLARLERQKPGVTSPDEDLRFVRGVVNTATGAIVRGAGFTVVRNGVGDVTITFTTAFKSPPAVVPGVGSTAITASAKLFNAEPTITTARILVFLTGTGAAADGLMHFTAAGPR